MSETCVLVVAKSPIPGLAKTRLCPPATAEQAAEIAAASVLDTLDAVDRTAGGRPVMAMTGDLRLAAHSTELRQTLNGWTVLDQRGEAFAERLTAAHVDTHAAHPGLPVVQIGMDTPQVTPELLAEACDRLAGFGVDAVLGLAEDGGWWAAGFREPRSADVLRDIPTSRGDTGKLTLAALRAAGLRVELLPELSDVDDMAAACAVAEQVPGSRFAAAVAAVPKPRLHSTA